MPSLVSSLAGALSLFPVQAKVTVLSMKKRVNVEAKSVSTISHLRSDGDSSTLLELEKMKPWFFLKGVTLLLALLYFQNTSTVSAQQCCASPVYGWQDDSLKDPNCNRCTTKMIAISSQTLTSAGVLMEARVFLDSLDNSSSIVLEDIPDVVRLVNLKTITFDGLGPLIRIRNTNVSEDSFTKLTEIKVSDPLRHCDAGSLFDIDQMHEKPLKRLKELDRKFLLEPCEKAKAAKSRTTRPPCPSCPSCPAVGGGNGGGGRSGGASSNSSVGGSSPAVPRNSLVGAGSKQDSSKDEKKEGCSCLVPIIISITAASLFWILVAGTLFFIFFRHQKKPKDTEKSKDVRKPSAAVPNLCMYIEEIDRATRNIAILAHQNFTKRLRNTIYLSKYLEEVGYENGNARTIGKLFGEKLDEMTAINETRKKDGEYKFRDYALQFVPLKTWEPIDIGEAREHVKAAKELYEADIAQQRSEVPSFGKELEIFKIVPSYDGAEQRQVAGAEKPPPAKMRANRRKHACVVIEKPRPEVCYIDEDEPEEEREIVKYSLEQAEKALKRLEGTAEGAAKNGEATIHITKSMANIWANLGATRAFFSDQLNHAFQERTVIQSALNSLCRFELLYRLDEEGLNTKMAYAGVFDKDGNRLHVVKDMHVFDNVLKRLRTECKPEDKPLYDILEKHEFRRRVQLYHMDRKKKNEPPKKKLFYLDPAPLDKTDFLKMYQPYKDLEADFDQAVQLTKEYAKKGIIWLEDNSQDFNLSKLKSITSDGSGPLIFIRNTNVTNESFSQLTDINISNPLHRCDFGSLFDIDYMHAEPFERLLKLDDKFLIEPCKEAKAANSPTCPPCTTDPSVSSDLCSTSSAPENPPSTKPEIQVPILNYNKKELCPDWVPFWSIFLFTSCGWVVVIGILAHLLFRYFYVRRKAGKRSPWETSDGFPIVTPNYYDNCLKLIDEATRELAILEITTFIRRLKSDIFLVDNLRSVGFYGENDFQVWNLLSETLDKTNHIRKTLKKNGEFDFRDYEMEVENVQDWTFPEQRKANQNLYAVMKEHMAVIEAAKKKGAPAGKEIQILKPVDVEERERAGAEDKIPKPVDIKEREKAGTELKILKPVDIKEREKARTELKILKPFDVEMRGKAGAEDKIPKPVDVEDPKKAGAEDKATKPVDVEDPKKAGAEDKTTKPVDVEKREKTVNKLDTPAVDEPEEKRTEKRRKEEKDICYLDDDEASIASRKTIENSLSILFGALHDLHTMVSHENPLRTFPSTTYLLNIWSNIGAVKEFFELQVGQGQQEITSYHSALKSMCRYESLHLLEEKGVNTKVAYAGLYTKDGKRAHLVKDMHVFYHLLQRLRSENKPEDKELLKLLEKHDLRRRLELREANLDYNACIGKLSFLDPVPLNRNRFMETIETYKNIQNDYNKAMTLAQEYAKKNNLVIREVPVELKEIPKIRLANAKRSSEALPKKEAEALKKEAEAPKKDTKPQRSKPSGGPKKVEKSQQPSSGNKKKFLEECCDQPLFGWEDESLGGCQLPCYTKMIALAKQEMKSSSEARIFLSYVKHSANIILEDIPDIVHLDSLTAISFNGTGPLIRIRNTNVSEDSFLNLTSIVVENILDYCSAGTFFDIDYMHPTPLKYLQNLDETFLLEPCSKAKFPFKKLNADDEDEMGKCNLIADFLAIRVHHLLVQKSSKPLLLGC
ncbi:unnamed protein product [Caenorhabditis auriculariae]|uniref:Uncharacterized protein n=1 Tax=Caenorhabditis auriculariae TaxID=2777116 RepID=A0A8S1HLG5_9PELO|nr:unnamed protein product [Caenorhabditis auriculariae]